MVSDGQIIVRAVLPGEDDPFASDLPRLTSITITIHYERISDLPDIFLALISPYADPYKL
jgi:hypothetical protein